MKKKLVPELRFPEFSGEWEIKKFGSLGEFGKTYSYSRNDEGIGEYYHIHYGDIHSKFNGFINKDTEMPSIMINKNHEILNNGDIVIADASEDYDDLGKTIVIHDTSNRKIVSGSHTFKFTPNKELHPIFYMNYSKTNSYRKFTRVNGTGVSVLGLSKKNLSNMEIIIPSKQEQSKIARLFTLIDNKIKKQEEKIINLEEYKNEMMQKIFSQEIRFKDENGEDYLEWEEKKLGDTINHCGGTALESLVKHDGTHNFISIGNYSKDGKYIDNKQRINVDEKTKTKILNKNDLVMILNDKTLSGDLIGSSIFIEEDDKYIYNQRSERIVCKDNISPIFMWFMLNSREFRRKVFSISQGATQIYVNFPMVNKIMIKLPLIKEQEKIASFLLTVDSKIGKEKEKLYDLKELKKSFMQKMFI